MKKLSIHLDNNTEDAARCYYPGNTIHGTVRFDSSASVKYTCIKIRFVGTVSTKIAKTTDEVFVLSDQVVLLGQANNATEAVLPQGRHAWIFAFDVPLQHIPSSGKYRHGTVKYTLTATVASKSFLGSMQEIKANKNLQLQDLVSCALEPYCNPVTVTGSSNVKPETNKPKNLASAAVNLSQSAFLKGQKIQMVIDLTHPRTLHRDPGCWVQLIRKESYCAGEQSKEYSHTVASSTIALHLDTAKHPGKVFADVTLPIDCPPTMFTTRVISIQYYLLLLFDMRPKTGFLERRNRQTLSKKVRTKLLSSPGGFEVEVPVVIATVSDDTLQAQPKPWTQLSSSPSDVDMKLTGAVSQLSLGSLPTPTPSPSLQPSSPYSTLPGSYPAVPKTPPAQIRRSPDSDSASSSSYTPRTQYQSNAATVGHSHQWKGSSDRRAATLPAFGSVSQASSSSLHLSTFSKPLPTIPNADISSPSLSNTSSSPFTSQAALFATHGHGGGSSSSPVASSSTSPSTYSSSPGAPSPQSYVPPTPVSGHGYPRDKENFTFPGPAARQIQLPQQPQLVRVQSATAPFAVDLGLGAASPAPLHRHLQRGSFTLSQFAAGEGAAAGSGSGSSSGSVPSSNRPDSRRYRLSTVPDIKTGPPMPPSGPTDHGLQQIPFQGSAMVSSPAHFRMDTTRYQQQQQQQHQWSSSAPVPPPRQQYQQHQQQPAHSTATIHHGIRNSVLVGENDPAPPYSAVSL